MQWGQVQGKFLEGFTYEFFQILKKRDNNIPSQTLSENKGENISHIILCGYSYPDTNPDLHNIRKYSLRSKFSINIDI